MAEANSGSKGGQKPPRDGITTGANAGSRGGQKPPRSR
jgi:hypothetical protein